MRASNFSPLPSGRYSSWSRLTMWRCAIAASGRAAYAIRRNMTKKRRGRRPLPPGVKKEKLVQTRVPGVLDETLREQARKNRVSVSQLIRNVLEDTFNLVENAVSE